MLENRMENSTCLAKDKNRKVGKRVAIVSKKCKKRMFQERLGLKQMTLAARAGYRGCVRVKRKGDGHVSLRNTPEPVKGHENKNVRNPYKFWARKTSTDNLF